MMTKDFISIVPRRSAFPDFFTGLKLGGCYCLRRRVETGGRSEVWLAFDEVLGKEVSLHFIPSEVRANVRAMEELRGHVKRGRRVIHPSILRVYDFLEEAGWAAVCMDRFEGGCLGGLLEGKNPRFFAPVEVLPWLLQLCETLADAHKIHLVHQAISPANLFLASGRLLVANFGISRCIHLALRAEGDPMDLDFVCSSPQAVGGAASAGDDIYAFGALMHTLLAGEPPARMLEMSSDRDPVSITQHRFALGHPGRPIPEAWEKIAAACLAKDPEQRPGGWAEIVAALTQEDLEEAPPEIEVSAVLPIASRGSEGAISVAPPDQRENLAASMLAEAGGDFEKLLPAMNEPAIGKNDSDPARPRFSRAALINSGVLLTVGFLGYFFYPLNQILSERIGEMRSSAAALEIKAKGLPPADPPRKLDGVVGVEPKSNVKGSDDAPRREVPENGTLGAPAVAESAKAKPMAEIKLATEIPEEKAVDAAPTPQELEELAALRKVLVEQAATAQAASDEAQRTAQEKMRIAEDAKKALVSLETNTKKKWLARRKVEAELAVLQKALEDKQRLVETAAKAVADASARVKEERGEPRGEPAAQVQEKAPEESVPVPVPARVSEPAPMAAALTKPVVPSIASPVPVAVPSAPPAAAAVPFDSKKGFENSLGMRFLPVGELLFSVWTTRVKDFGSYAKTTRLKSKRWKELGLKQGPEHPVVNVTWNEANAFCKWLTDKEHREGVILPNQSYRLPTDLEWSKAAGLPAESGDSPMARDMQLLDFYPWGTAWPPPAGSGNYTGEETGSDGAIKGYNDGFVSTSPVGSFAANPFGLFDMGGNVWQWCLDSWTRDQKAKVLRGASWANGALKLSLLSSCRLQDSPDASTEKYGFRCVLVTSEQSDLPQR